MISRLIRHSFVFPVFLLCFFLISCTARVEGSLYSGGSGTMKIEASLETQTAALLGRLRDFAQKSGSSSTAHKSPVIDAPSIAAAMRAAPGIAAVSLANTGPSSLSGAIEVSKADDFLAVTGRREHFVTFTENSEGGGSALFMLDRETAPAVIALLSPEVSSYLEALMAPAATGEDLTKDEYIEIVSSIYSSAIADEIKKGAINISISFPGRIRGVQGGNALKNTATFTVPLLDLLVLDKPLRYQVTW
jgi:hypothetical protein